MSSFFPFLPMFYSFAQTQGSAFWLATQVLRKMVQFDDAALTQHEGMLNHVFQLPHVARKSHAP